jgi:hypothetical protein
MAKRPPKHEMLFFVYVLGSRSKKDCRTYVGWTTDLERRLQQHNAESVRSRLEGGNGSCSIPNVATLAAKP